MARKKLPYPLLIVAMDASLLKVQIGPRREPHLLAPMFQFYPWDRTHNPDTMRETVYCAMQVDSANHYKGLVDKVLAQVGAEKVYDQFKDVYAALDWFLSRPSYFLGCPITGKLFKTVEDYQTHLNQIRQTFGEKVNGS